MTTFSDMVYMLGGVPVGAFDPVMLAGGKWYFCDPTHGSANADATTPETACSNLKTVYDKCRDAYNDGVIFIGGATAYNPAAAFTWSKNYTHLLGASSSVPGKGQRCRVVGLAATGLTQAMTISGSGCVIKNIQFNNETASGAVGSLTVSGLRNRLDNVFCMNPTSVTATAWAMKVTGAENAFVRCSFGQITNARSAASYGVWIASAANSLKFIGCEFASWSDQVAHELVHIDADNTGEGWQVQFEDCLFQNLGNALLTAAVIDASTAAYHQVIFRGKSNTCVKCTAVANPLTYTYGPDQAAAASGLLYVAINES
jgi:hypothetical protein